MAEPKDTNTRDEVEQSGIPQITDKKSKLAPIIVGGIAFCMVGFLAVYSFWSEVQSEPVQKTEKAKEEYRNVSAIEVPDIPREPEPEPPPETEPEPEPSQPPQPQVQRPQAPAGNQRDRAAERRADARRRSPLLIASSRNGDQQSSGSGAAQRTGDGSLLASAGGSAESPRMQAIREQQERAMEMARNAGVSVDGDSAPGGSSGGRVYSGSGGGGFGGLGGMGGMGGGEDTLEGTLQRGSKGSTRAYQGPPLSHLLAEGTMIDCTLETRIISEVAGKTKCQVSRDIYSADGSRVLVPRGSTITGQYRAGMARGRVRIFVSWNRLRRPDGVLAMLDSPGTGPLGASGHEGYRDTHFFERFGASLLLSVIGIEGAKYVEGDGEAALSAVESFNDAAEKALEVQIDIPPTLYKHQGDRIKIFVSKDVDFRNV
ncbi:TrbI/VirB10 family protein [Arhodomonas sp. AD133]|uniref:TrbI/VirB10 family protein n=1 Tax=Arhodomonas sp. AD133 TaxID=3415009 RepID=UPI003EBC75B2